MTKSVVLYGLSGAETQYKALYYYNVFEQDISISNIKYQARMMRMRNPSIKQVFAIDNRPGLKGEYIESIKVNSIESCAIFKDTLEREGCEITVTF